MSAARPFILYVPGLMPKPPADVHERALSDSLRAGLRQIGAGTEPADDGFALYAWTYGFYGQHRDFDLDRAAVDRLVANPVASEDDIRESSTHTRQLHRTLFRIGNALPFLIPHFATDRQRLHVRDLNHYAHDRDGSATAIREGLKAMIRDAGQQPILLIGHSMGSVICWDTLWEMAFDDGAPATVSLFVTMGSPLGQRYVQSRLLSHRRREIRGFPPGLERWINLAATGDMTSLDQRLGNDFACRFPDADVSIEDHLLVNAFRLDGVINPHAEYGYLANPVTARFVSDWWQRATRR